MAYYGGDGGVPFKRSTILYRKVGRKYVAVSEYSEEFSYQLPEGCHLAVVRPGMSSRRYNIDPDLAPLIAAGRYCEDEVAMAIVEASEKQPFQKPVTEEQAAAWRAFQEAMGSEVYSVSTPSAREIAVAGVEALVKEAEKLLQHESVRKAYDHFMLMCKLVKEKQ